VPNTDMVFRLFGFDVSAGTALDRVRLRAVETGGALETMGRIGVMAGVAVGVGVATMGFESIKMAANFQRSMLLLQTQAQVPKAQIQGLGDAVLNLAGKVGFSPDSLANSLYFVESNMASFGIKPAQAMHMVEVAAEGAQIGMADLQDTTTALTATMAAYRGTNLTADSAMAILNATVGTGEMKMQDLNMAIKTGVMGTMQTYGVRLDEIGAALAVFGDNNLRGAAAGTALRMSVQAMAKPIAGGKAELAKLGLNVDSLRVKMSQKGLSGALDLFRSRLIANHVPMKQWGGIFTQVFGKKAGVGLLELLKEFDRYSSKIPALNKATKTFGTAWEQTQKTTQVQWDKLKSNFQALLIRIGNLLLPFANRVIEFFSKVVTWVSANLPRIVATAKTVWSNFVTAAQPVINWFKNELVPAIKNAADVILPALKGAFNSVSTTINQNHDTWVQLGRIVHATGVILTQYLIPAFAAVAAFLIGRLGPVFSTLVSMINTIVIPGFKLLWTVWKYVVGSIIHAAATLFGWVPGVGPKLQAAAREFDKFAASVDAALNGIDTSVSINIYAGLSGPGAALLKGVHTGYAASAIAKASYINGRAMGGAIPGGVPMLVGEKGAEYFIPDGPGHIVPNSDLGKYGSGWSGAGGGGNVHVVVNVRGTVGDDVHLAKTVVNAIRNAKQRGYRNLTLDLES
jgi:TP901 family phage tail tape measure protein